MYESMHALYAKMAKKVFEIPLEAFVQPQQLSNIHRVNFGVLSKQIELSDWHSSLTSSLSCCCLWPYF